MSDEQVETRSVQLSELQAGLHLQPGHQTILIVEGAKGTPLPGAGSAGTGSAGTGSDQPGSAGTAAAGQPSGESGGSADGTAAAGAGSATQAPGQSDPAKTDAGTTDAGTTDAGTTDAGNPGPAGSGAEQTTQPADPEQPTASMHITFDAAHYETDKAFPLPGSLDTFRAIAELAQKEPSRALLVLGHTDAVGTADHNLGLSTDRAAAVAAYLQNDVDAWLRFFDSAPGSKEWGTREEQQMLAALPFGGTAYLKGKPGDKVNAAVEKAFRAFQQASSLDQTGKSDSATRKALVAAYMAADGTSAPAATPLEKLGCGERHLKVKAKGANPANRRVEVLAFEKSPYAPSAGDYGGKDAAGQQKIYDAWMGISTAIQPAKGPAKAAPVEEDEDLSEHSGEHIDADPGPAPAGDEHQDPPPPVAGGDRIVNWPHQPVPPELIEGYKKGLLSTGGHLGKCLQLACDTAINAGAPGHRNPQSEYKATIDLSWKGRKISELPKAVTEGKLLPGMIIHVKAHPDYPQASGVNHNDSNHWFIYVGIGDAEKNGKQVPMFFDLDHHNLPEDPPRIEKRLSKDGKTPFGVRPPTAKSMEHYLAKMPQGQSIVRAFYDPFSTKLKG
jgi:outer membrane protein OmpA-like peptidoglycan-associated protein